MTSLSNPIATRLRRRKATCHASSAASKPASTTFPGRSRVTRRSIAQARNQNGRNEKVDGDDSMDSGSDRSKDESNEGGDDDKIYPERRTAKRPRAEKEDGAGSRPKRRQLRNRVLDASDESQSENAAYPSPSSEGVSRRRPEMTVSTRSGQNKKQTTEKGLSIRLHSRGEKGASIKKAGDKPLTPSASTIPAKSPPWAALPYLVLCRIFKFASQNLDTVNAVRQFVSAGLACRAFAEPMLRALYECPPLLTMNMAHSLVHLLGKPPSTTILDYQRKVKSLRIEVGSLASRTYKGSHLDIHKLVAHCPGLVDLDLNHYKDLPPYRQLNENLRWSYPQGLFEALGGLPNSPDGGTARQATRLRSWRWNQRFMGKDMSLESIMEIHLSQSFASLHKISFINYQRPSLAAKKADDPQAVAEDIKQADMFAELLHALPNLTHLAIESSTVANEHLLPLLPKSLQSLELVNCWDVSAEHFSEYLVTHGQLLRQLTLHHNQSLSLAFLPVLSGSCPGLASLRMNLTYYNHHAFYNDSNPLYDNLLLESQVPTWPTSIEVIELEHLRKWEPYAAEVFFHSLVDSAQQMPKLRTLAIKAMLDIPWRQRCEMRDRWEATLNRVFKRRTTMPEPAASLQYYHTRTESTKSLSKTKRHQQGIDATPQRRSRRIASCAPSLPSHFSSRDRGLRKPKDGLTSYLEPDSDEDFDLIEDDQEEEANEESKYDTPDDCPDNGHVKTGNASQASMENEFIQGMCDVVDIRIDNQKPREIQYHMDDFLDGSDSGSDNEWTGDETDIVEYAW